MLVAMLSPFRGSDGEAMKHPAPMPVVTYRPKLAARQVNEPTSPTQRQSAGRTAALSSGVGGIPCPRRLLPSSSKTPSV